MQVIIYPTCGIARFRIKKFNMCYYSFIAELFLLKVLASKAVCRCIDILLTANDDFSLDCLCTLLSTCGKQLEESLRKKVTFFSR